MTREFRRYRSDDRDLDGHDLEIVVLPPDGNGDWYVSIVEHGDKLGPTVRVTASGAPRGQELVCVAVAKLYRAMGGESIQDEAGDDLAAFVRLRDGEEAAPSPSIRVTFRDGTHRDLPANTPVAYGERSFPLSHLRGHPDVTFGARAVDVETAEQELVRVRRQLADETTRANLWEAIAKRLGAGSQ
jgi:hypothetical protein